MHFMILILVCDDHVLLGAARLALSGDPRVLLRYPLVQVQVLDFGVLDRGRVPGVVDRHVRVGRVRLLRVLSCFFGSSLPPLQGDFLVLRRDLVVKGLVLFLRLRNCPCVADRIRYQNRVEAILVCDVFHRSDLVSRINVREHACGELPRHFLNNPHFGFGVS